MIKASNLLFVVAALLFLNGSILHAQDDLAEDDDGTGFLGTVIEKQIETDSESGIIETEDAIESNEDFIDPDFLKDDGEADYDDYLKVKVRILDKITANTETFDLEIGKTVAYGSMRIRPMTCKKAPPIEEPESTAFLQIWEKTFEGNDEWIFSGWMFASSPSLSAMEHPVYDVWVIDCNS